MEVISTALKHDVVPKTDLLLKNTYQMPELRLLTYTFFFFNFKKCVTKTNARPSDFIFHPAAAGAHFDGRLPKNG